MTPLLKILFILIFNQAPQNQLDIIGNWAIVTEKIRDVKSSHIECPDVLRFNTNKKYCIYNDCFGPDPKQPIVETGQWELKINILSLKQRKFTTNYFFFSADKTIQFNLVRISSDTLCLEYGQEKQFYKRTK